jgi:hypothetical protein
MQLVVWGDQPRDRLRLVGQAAQLKFDPVIDRDQGEVWIVVSPAVERGYDFALSR